MAKGNLRVTKESNTGRNLVFQNTKNNEILSSTELISRLETGNSAYNDGYYIKHQDGQKFVVSKPDRNEKNNLG